MQAHDNTLIRMLVGAALMAAGATSAATYTASWVGGGDNLWNNATQWSPTARYPDNGQPAAGDVYTVTVNSTTLLELNQDVNIETFALQRGTVTNSGHTLTVDKSSTIGNASQNTFLTGTGKLVAKEGLHFRPMLTSNPPIRNSWTIDLLGDSSTTGHWGWYMRNTGTITIGAGTVFQLQGNSSLTIDNATGVINNDGTFVRTSSTNETEVSNQFNNRAGGRVEAASGSLKLTGGGTHAGVFIVAPSNTLTFGGTHTFNSGAAVIATGSVSFVGAATFSAGALLTAASNVTSTAALSVAETTPVGGHLTGSGNAFQLNGAGDVTVSGKFNWIGGAAGAPSLSGAGVLTVAGGMTLSGAANYVNNKTVVLSGDSAIDTSSGWWITNNGEYRIQPGATLELKSLNGATDMIKGSGTIRNKGLFLRAQGNERRALNTLDNTGTVRADAGGRFDFTGTVLQLSGASITGGVWHANNGVINLPGSNLTTIGPDAVVRLTGTGTINRVGTSLTNVNGGFHVDGGKGFTTGGGGLTVGATGTLGGDGSVTGNVTVAGGTLAPGASGASDTLTVAGNLALQNGTTIQWDGDADAADRIAATGTLTLATAATVVMASPAGLTLPAEIVLFEAGALTGETTLSGWSVTPPYRAARLGTTVVLRRPTGTVIAIR